MGGSVLATGLGVVAVSWVMKKGNKK
jgi:hypothetical protein